MIGNLVISEVDVMYVALTKAEKHVPYAELPSTIESSTL
jgi:hypothetical protein